MSKRQKFTRVAKLIETATRLFIDKGYLRTQMADVKQAMGLSPWLFIVMWRAKKPCLISSFVQAQYQNSRSTISNCRLRPLIPETRSDSYVRLCGVGIRRRSGTHERR